PAMATIRWMRSQTGLTTNIWSDALGRAKQDSPAEFFKVTRSTDKVSRWLLDGDPAIRWQALRDVVGAAERTVERERQKVACDGWGARLLAKQDPEGTWAGGRSSDGGLYHPKWISTTYTMLLLRDFGLPTANRQARRACTLLLDQGLQRDGGINYGWT